MRYLTLLLLVLALFTAGCAELIAALPGQVPVDPCADDSALLRDEFDDPTAENRCGWVLFDEGSEVVELLDGTLQIVASSPGNAAITHTPDTFTDVEINVQTRQVSGPNDNAYGIICRYVDEDNFYMFLISGDGFYAIAKFESGTNRVQYLTGEEPDHFMYSEDLVNVGAATNRLAVRCQDNQLSLTVNGLEVETVIDNTHTSGRIGLVASVFEPERLEVQFDNVVVTQP